MMALQGTDGGHMMMLQRTYDGVTGDTQIGMLQRTDRDKLGFYRGLTSRHMIVLQKTDGDNIEDVEGNGG